MRFNEEFVEKILTGRKSASVRSNVRGMKTGTVKPLTSRGRRFAMAKIVEVRPIRFSQLGEEDAKRDGFDNLQQLVEGLKQFYKKLKPDSRLYVVRFEVVERF